MRAVDRSDPDARYAFVRLLIDGRDRIGDPLSVGRHLRVVDKFKRKIILSRYAGFRLRMRECGADNQQKRKNTLHESHHSEMWRKLPALQHRLPPLSGSDWGYRAA